MFPIPSTPSSDDCEEEAELDPHPLSNALFFRSEKHAEGDAIGDALNIFFKADLMEGVAGSKGGN